MRIMVFDVQAVSGGALSVLYDFYDEFKLDLENQYIFVLSLPELEETDNIKVLRFPWIKKSWIHRLYFDYFIASKLIKKYNVDKVLSLQNVIIPFTNTYQSVFVHNALPFSEHHISFQSDKVVWVYQNIIGHIIKKSLKKSDQIIVQSNWMKKMFIEKLDIYPNKIEIKHPRIDYDIKENYRVSNEEFITFFYPANGAIFKNHKVIVEACVILKNHSVENYKVVFTLNGNENKHIIRLHEFVIGNNLPIEFIGYIDRKVVFDFYTRSILLFPSFIETVGLPLIEARYHETPIIVSNTVFSNELLSDYDKKYMFDYDDYKKLANIMSLFITK